MNRRHALLVIASLPAAGIAAQAADLEAGGALPVYIRGSVATLLWSDPQPFLELTTDPGAEVPRDIRNRMATRQQPDQDLADLIRRARPADPTVRLWRVPLPTLARLTSLEVPRPKMKDAIGVIGFAGESVDGLATLVPAVLILDGRPFRVSQRR